MQLYTDVLLSRDQHRSYVKAVEHDRLAKLARQPRRSLRERSQRWVRIIGLFFTF